MKIFKISQSSQIVYHISNKRFAKFNPQYTAQGLLWFSRDKDDLIKNRHGASIGKGDIYLYTCEIFPNKVAGWTEYDKLMIAQLRQEGYDLIDLGEDVAIINPNIVRIKNIELVPKNT